MQQERIKRRKIQDSYDPQKAYDDTVKEVNAGIRNALNGLIKIVLAYSSLALGLFFSIIQKHDIVILICNINIVQIIICVFSFSIIFTIVLPIIEQLSLYVSLHNMEKAIHNNIVDSNKIFNFWKYAFYTIETLIVVSVIIGTLCMAYYYIALFT